MVQRAKGSFPVHPVLIVDDEEEILRSFSIALRSGGVNNIIALQDPRDVEGILREQEPSVILLDLSMPYILGQELLKEISEDYPHIPVIIITGDIEVETAVECMKSKAFDYMVKPVEKSKLISGVKRAVEIKELRRQVEVLKQALVKPDPECHDAFNDIITRNHVMLSLFRYAECIATSPEPVLITGETGVGKELMARAIHRLSGRLGDFVAVNVAGVDDNVFSDTLFGHVKGAYTSAEARRGGMIEQASGGTLLLDEIGDLSTASQIKLLRLLQEGEYFPLGSDIAKASNARIIVTTNKDVSELQDSSQFRKDLYYRLCTHHIHIPPLRERMDDLPLLIEHFVNEAACDIGRPKPSWTDELLVLLSNYEFPGNIRELRSMIYDAVGTNRSGTVSLRRLRMRIGGSRITSSLSQQRWGHGDTGDFSMITKKLPNLNEATRQLIQEALRRTKGNKSMAARMLGISRQRLARYLKSMMDIQRRG